VPMLRDERYRRFHKDMPPPVVIAILTDRRAPASEYRAVPPSKAGSTCAGATRGGHHMTEHYDEHGLAKESESCKPTP